MSHLIVKHRSFWHSYTGMGVIVLSFLLAALGLFEFGRIQAGFDSLATARQQEQMQQHIDELQQQQTSLREQKAILERSTQIEQQAFKQLEGTVAQLQDEILELKEELDFYRGIVSPKDASKGLKVQGFELFSGAEPRQYHFKVVLTQVLDNTHVARGDLQLQVEGLIKGEIKSFDLKQLSDGVQKHAFRFKYFQVLEGDFLLPEGFKPHRVNVIVKPQSKTHKQLSQKFDWVVREIS